MLDERLSSTALEDSDLTIAIHETTCQLFKPKRVLNHSDSLLKTRDLNMPSFKHAPHNLHVSCHLQLSSLRVGKTGIGENQLLLARFDRR
jgi:hypothetical protein